MNKNKFRIPHNQLPHNYQSFDNTLNNKHNSRENQHSNFIANWRDVNRSLIHPPGYNPALDASADIDEKENSGLYHNPHQHSVKTPQMDK